jgi:hypothetical protein
MRTSRDTNLWKVRVLLNKDGKWVSKTFFYSREVFAKRWVDRAGGSENLHIDFYGKYALLEEDSG